MFYGYSAYEVFNILLKLLIFLGFAFLIDLYVNYGYRILLKRVKIALIKKGLIRLNWLVFIIFSIILVLYFIIPAKYCGDPAKTRKVFVIATFFILIYFPKMLFACTMLCRTIIYYISYILQKILKRRIVSDFLIRRYFLKTGFFLQLLITLIILIGIFHTSTSFTVKKQIIVYHDLPPSFHGFKVIHISDMHLGSFRNTRYYEKVVRKINALQADIIVFSGDMVNNTPDEALAYIPIFSRMNAKHGKFSVLGNHDFGDYVHCMNQSQKDSLVDKLVEIYREMGFVPLINSNRILKLYQDSLYIAGVNNIGSPPFKVYGDLEKALSGIEADKFTILLSHDPDHWKNEVKNMEHHIHLTLSGHTHGMQFGINTKLLKWSPIMGKYLYWAGLYKENNKYLYVNQGLGMIGFLGRIGIRPEITEIILKRE